MTRPAPPPSDDLARAIAACPDDPDLWDMLRAREFPGERVNLNPGTLGTPARCVRAARRGFDDDGRDAWPLGQYQRARADLRRARERARALWDHPRVGFTGGTSEAMTRLTLALHARLAPGPVRLLTSAHEHAGGLAGFLRHPAFAVDLLPDAALTDPAAVAALARERRPHVLLLSQITYTIGQVLPVSTHVAAVRAACPDVWIVVDAAQAVGQLPPALAGADATVASAHKWLFGPPGSGLVWLSERACSELAHGWAGEPLDPDSPCPALERAGGHDFSVHAGTAAALDLHAALGPEVVRARSRALADWFAAELHARLHDRAVAHHFFDPATGDLRDAPPPAAHGAVHVQFPALDPYPAYAALDARGVHLKCIKSTRPTGPALAVLRAGLPCYESPARLRRALDLLADALAGAP